MPYIVDRNNLVFNRQPINKNNTYSSTNKVSQTKNSANDTCEYHMNDLMSVFTHYDAKLGKNVSTPNELPNK